MPYVIRAVDKISKWNLGKDYNSRKLVDADPIGHLKTSNNELSVFVVDDLNDINHIVIALATTRDHFDKFHCVIAEKSELRKNRISMKHDTKTGNTPVRKANDQHWNLKNLKARDLEILAKIFLKSVNKYGNFKTINQQKVKQLIKSKIDDAAYLDSIGIYIFPVPEALITQG